MKELLKTTQKQLQHLENIKTLFAGDLCAIIKGQKVYFNADDSYLILTLAKESLKSLIGDIKNKIELLEDEQIKFPVEHLPYHMKYDRIDWSK